MFVRVLNRSSSQPRELTLASIKAVEADAVGAAILTQDGAGFYAPHPAEIVRKALTLYTALLGGREEAQVPLPSFSPLSNLPQPQGLAALHLDLTKERIEIVEEIAPVDADGNITLDAGQATVRTLSYSKTAAQQQAAEAPKNPQIGQTVEGKGIYMGVWEPKDREGKSLGKTFAVYAAPVDLTDASGRKLVATFKDTAKRMTALRNWHGHDGGDFANDAALYRGLADGTGIGKWFIPTRDLLTGTDLDGNKVQNDNLVAHKDKLGEITTSREGCGYYDYPNYYWTLSEPRDNSYYVWCARLADGGGGWGIKDNGRQSCRPCRVEALTI
jgi:hypothetical protein